MERNYSCPKERDEKDPANVYKTTLFLQTKEIEYYSTYSYKVASYVT